MNNSKTKHHHHQTKVASPTQPQKTKGLIIYFILKDSNFHPGPGPRRKAGRWGIEKEVTVDGGTENRKTGLRTQDGERGRRWGERTETEEERD